MMTPNPYAVEDTCQCCAYSEGECACGGYVDRKWARIWEQGYEAALADIRAAGSGSPVIRLARAWSGNVEG